MILDFDSNNSQTFFSCTSLPHSTSADTVINGYTIPAGTTVIANMDSILLTADTWEDPLKFKPERFLDAQGKLTVPDQLIPFGIGKPQPLLI